MVALIDAKATFEVEGEVITLRLNYGIGKALKRVGIPVLEGKMPTGTEDTVSLICCCTAIDHPGMTEDEAFSIAVKGADNFAKALTELFEDFAGQVGNATKPARPKVKSKP